MLLRNENYKLGELNYKIMLLKLQDKMARALNLIGNSTLTIRKLKND